MAKRKYALDDPASLSGSKHAAKKPNRATPTPRYDPADPFATSRRGPRDINALHPRQERFCQEYLIDFSPQNAYLRAGYKPSKHSGRLAWQLLHKPHVQLRITHLKEERAKRLKITADRVIQMLLDSFRDAATANQHSAAIRAAELLGKHIGMFKDVNISTVRVAGISGSDDATHVDEDIDKLISTLQRTKTTPPPSQELEDDTPTEGSA